MVSKGLNILVVDDSPIILERVSQTLAARGHQVELADGAMAGMHRLKAGTPDVILLDVEMPNMNGFEFCALIRKQEAWRSLPVIFLSGRGDEESVLSGFTMGGNDYIAKPFSDRELVMRVETHGFKARMERELEQKTRALEDLSERQEAIIAERTAALEASRLTLTETLARLASERSFQDELVDSRRLVSLGKLVADVAHQINTPLGNSIMLVSFIESRLREVDAAGPGGAEAGSSAVEGMLDHLATGLPLLQNNLARIEELVSRFRSITAEQSGNERVAFSIDPIFELLAARKQPELQARSIALVFDNRLPDGTELRGYPGALNLILENLVDNAMAHAFAGRRGGRISVRSSLEDGQVVVECRDDGCGMDEEVRRRIWEPFFTTSREPSFMGLGLFVVRNLVLGRLKGRVVCESETEAGSVFRLVFPRVLD